eukprot:CAMPEP_0198695182 /NCGR_PEP_ID=MMETSP1468-20131203/283269_1 /TAXON_ID=1461545 /ORGANISM="Mantoniella sp, Strain CCMP1436" /LENGTH=104 /DNA_ID=CAMNT_0044450785 /DNA_START=373 /DNA_END=683 /DNA_ORIENTATION=+
MHRIHRVGQSTQRGRAEAFPSTPASSTSTSTSTSTSNSFASTTTTPGTAPSGSIPSSSSVAIRHLDVERAPALGRTALAGDDVGRVLGRKHVVVQQLLPGGDVP